MTDYAELLQLVHPTAEATTLKALCSGEIAQAIALAEQLEESDYHDPRYQVIFAAVTNLLRGIEPLDTRSIVTECQAVVADRKLKLHVTAEFVESLSGDLNRAVPYANTVKRMAWLRRTADFAYWLVKELQTHPNPDDLFAAAQEHFQVLQPKRTNIDFVYGWDTVRMQQEAIAQRIGAIIDDASVRFDWPWRTWNRMIRPLRVGMVGILAAPDGMGKSLYLEEVAEHWAKAGKQVVYVHLEDALEYKLDRRTARHALVDMDHIEDGTMTPIEKSKIGDADTRMARWAGNLHYYHAAGRSMAEIVRELESRITEGVCQSVVFDYLDKVQPTRGQAKLFGDNLWERQAADMEALKTFAEKAGIPVLSATQGNKAMQGNGTQTRASIQGSGQKSQKAQLVVILTREIVGEGGLYDADGVELATAGEYSPIVKVRVDKQNRGRTGSFQQFLLGKYFTVRDIEP